MTYLFCISDNDTPFPSLQIKNDAFARANRASRAAGASDRMVEIRQPLGMDLDEDDPRTLQTKNLARCS